MFSVSYQSFIFYNSILSPPPLFCFKAKAFWKGVYFTAISYQIENIAGQLPFTAYTLDNYFHTITFHYTWWSSVTTQSAMPQFSVKPQEETEVTFHTLLKFINYSASSFLSTPGNTLSLARDMLLFKLVQNILIKYLQPSSISFTHFPPSYLRSPHTQ